MAAVSFHDIINRYDSGLAGREGRETPLLILGVDPGYAIVGYGAVRMQAYRFAPVGFGAITTEADEEFSRRLELIYDQMTVILEKCRPDAFAIEKLYFQNNQKTAIQVAEARGVILLAARKFCVPIFEYTPLQVKMAVTGYGQAMKPQVMEMTRRLLHLREGPKPDDTADALAVAICHGHATGSQLRRNLLQGRADR